MNILCFFGNHKRKLVHVRISTVGNYEWYECENCDKKLFTVDGNMWGNDKWKNNWHKTPEEDKLMYDSNGKLKDGSIEQWFQRWKKERIS